MNSYLPYATAWFQITKAIFHGREIFSHLDPIVPRDAWRGGPAGDILFLLSI